MKKVYYGELYHHGVKGMKWGVRRYQNEDGTLTEAGRKRLRKNASYGKVARKAVGDVAKAGVGGILAPAATTIALAGNGSKAATGVLVGIDKAIAAGKAAANLGFGLSTVGKASVAALKTSLLFSGSNALIPVLGAIGAVSASALLVKGTVNLARNIKTTKQNRQILDDDANGGIKSKEYYQRYGK